MKKAIAYYRVSTGRQGRSGLGLEAQQKAVLDFSIANEYLIIKEYIEIESGKWDSRPELQSAIIRCKQQEATLLIAKLDRLSRSVAFIATLMECGVDFKVVDNPYAEKFTLHILAAVAQKEREDNSRRTKDALAAAKRRGVVLGKFGRNVLSKRNQLQAEQFAVQMQPIIIKIQQRGICTLRAIRNELNRLGVPTYRKNCHWHLATVYKLIKRIPKNEPL